MWFKAWKGSLIVDSILAPALPERQLADSGSPTICPCCSACD